MKEFLFGIDWKREPHIKVMTVFNPKSKLNEWYNKERLKTEFLDIEWQDSLTTKVFTKEYNRRIIGYYPFYDLTQNPDPLLHEYPDYANWQEMEENRVSNGLWDLIKDLWKKMIKK